MTSRRIAQVNEQMKREISRILRREVNDPRVGLVVVTGVDVSGDLSYAKVYVRPAGSSAPGSEAASESAEAGTSGAPGPSAEGEEREKWTSMMEGLEAASPFIRRQLAESITTRRVPELDFREDRTLEKAMRIEEILDDVRDE